MRPTPLFSGILYFALGIIFTILAVRDVQINGEWGILTYLFVLIATFDIGNGIKLFHFHFKLKTLQNGRKNNS